MNRVLGPGPRAPRCALGRLVPTTVGAEPIKATSWRDHRLLVVALDDPRLGWADRELVRTIGDKLYGGREARR